MKSRTSLCSTSRKCSAMVRPDRATRIRTPGTHSSGRKERRFVGDTAIPHFTPEVVTLTATLADAGEDGVPLYSMATLWISSWIRTVLPTPAPPNRPIFPPFGYGYEQIDDLDFVLENLDSRVLLVKRGSVSVNAFVRALPGNGFAAVDGLAQHGEHSAERVSLPGLQWFCPGPQPHTEGKAARCLKA